MTTRVLRTAGRSVRAARGAARALATLANAAPAADGVRVWYGIDVPPIDRIAHGGIVKLQALAAAFPSTSRGFNLLYLVSSRLPDTAPLLARAAKARGAKVVVNQNGVAYAGWYGPGWEAVNAPMAALLQTADHVLYQSRFCQNAADRFLGTAVSPNEILYNPVDTERFTPAPAAERPLTLLLGGSQDFRYRVESAVQVLATVSREHRDARLIISGGLRWTTPREAERDLGHIVNRAAVADRIELTGPYTQADAPALFARADLLIHTKYKDPSPTVALEAMACGLPVVYSASGGVPELVGDEAGIGVQVADSWTVDQPPDASAMAAAVCEAYARRRDFADAARQRAVEHFDERRWIARHREVFASLCH
jgi:glycosyltransferase involved in cell wall biosynthesis